MDFIITYLPWILGGLLVGAIIDWMVKSGEKAEKQAKRDKGFITPPKKQEAPPGLFERFKAWERRHKKKLWALVIILFFYLYVF